MTQSKLRLLSQKHDERELLDLLRELEAAAAVCQYALKSRDREERRAAVRVVKDDLRKVVNR